MNTLIATLTSAKAAKIAGIAAAILAVGIAARIDYDTDADELTIRVRKIRPLTSALKRATLAA